MPKDTKSPFSPFLRKATKNHSLRQAEESVFVRSKSMRKTSFSKSVKSVTKPFSKTLNFSTFRVTLLDSDLTPKTTNIET